MNFFNQKPDNMLIKKFLDALANDSCGQNDGSIRRHMAEYERRNIKNGFDPVWDDNQPDDYVFNGWGGLDDNE